MPKRKTVGGNTRPTTTTSPVSHWTEGRYRAFITSALRSGFRKFPNKFVVLKNAIKGRKINKKTGRLATHYVCASCKKQFVATEVEVDHVDPVVSIKEGFVSWDVYISRLYCGVDNLQVLCKPCHKVKSAEERKQACGKTTAAAKCTKKPRTSSRLKSSSN